ncbi:unnamed protein product [Paramecium octaurelia]|uniref:Uncharacterized protein n=1 Tax=Paramecium octaurelia TaxID=43137 RepID=A0A8S1UZW9_PAROT|nr:unnamed protein product [Paramecium octaurelia]
MFQSVQLISQEFFTYNNNKEEENENKQKEKEKEEGKRLLNGRKRRRSLYLIFAWSSKKWQHILFVSVQSESSDIMDLVAVFNQKIFAECYYSYSDNALRKQLGVESYTFVGHSSVQVFNFLIAILYNLEAAIHQITHSQFRLPRCKDRYEILQVFNNIFILTPCDYIVQIETELTYEICLIFNDGVLRQGYLLEWPNISKFIGKSFTLIMHPMNPKIVIQFTKFLKIRGPII